MLTVHFKELSLVFDKYFHFLSKGKQIKNKNLVSFLMLLVNSLVLRKDGFFKKRRKSAK